MVGDFPNKLSYEKINGWFVETVLRLNTDQNDNSSRDFYPEDGFQRKIDIHTHIGFLKYIHQLCIDANIFEKFYPLLYIPLKYSENLRLWDIQTSQLEGERNTPPSIALLKRSMVLYADPIEAYDLPITMDGYDITEDMTAYYSVFRDPESLERDWAYIRSLTIAFVGKAYKQRVYEKNAARTSYCQIQKDIEAGKAPPGIDRIEAPMRTPPNSQACIHFK
jgi:hypothetical protein